MLALHLDGVVVVESLFLLLGGALRFDRGDLWLGVDGHHELAGLHTIAGLDLDPREAPADLRLERGRPARHDGRDVFTALRHRSKRNGNRLAPAWPACRLRQVVLPVFAGNRKERDLEQLRTLEQKCVSIRNPRHRIRSVR